MARLASLDDLVGGTLRGEVRAVARLLSLVENDAPGRREVAAALTPYAGRARVIGLTGPPGVGKSTSTSLLVAALRAEGRRVAVLAIDPSSPFTGGALLGDRIRMHEHATDDRVFIRSMASRGHLGGLAAAAPQALRVLDAAGFDVVLIETVGVGQAEVEVASLADSTLVLLAPGMGDGVQAAKAGVLEIADVLVVNKADRDGADAVARDLRHMLATSGRARSGTEWRPLIVKTVAARGEGGARVLEALDRHSDWLAASGRLAARRAARAAVEIEAIAMAEVRARLAALRGSAALPAVSARVAAGEIDPFTAADQVVAAATG